MLLLALFACAGVPEDTGLLSNGWQPGEPFHGYVWGVPEGETLSFIADLSTDARPGEGPNFCFELADDGDFYAIWPDDSENFGIWKRSGPEGLGVESDFYYVVAGYVATQAWEETEGFDVLWSDGTPGGQRFIVEPCSML